MSVIGSNILAGASGQGGEYTIEESLRFNASQSSYLSWTPASAGNRKTWTWSGWVKYSTLDNGVFNQAVFWANGTGGNAGISFEQSPNTPHRLYVYNAGNQIETTQVFRDPSAWYHIVAVIDTTQATASNRTKLYVNGIQITALTTANYPAQNADSGLNETTEHNIGKQTGQSRYFDGYITEVNFIDGQALDPSSFGEFDSVTGVWKPAKYTGTYGTNGFYLPMQLDNTVEGFNTVTYIGTGSTQNITGVGFSPDLVWMKSRSSGTRNHFLFDSVRGAGNALYSNLTNAEASSFGVSAFNTDGFTVGTNGNGNESGGSYVAWCWDAGSSTVSNTDGSITSSVRANPAYGFSVVTYTGNGSAGATWGHGLGVAPSMVIIKNRSATGSWMVYHTSIGNTGAVFLNITNATITSSTYFNNTTPTSDVFSIGDASACNGSGNSIVAYCFSEVAGYSKFGSYTGTGASGNTVTTGFKPAFVMIKRTDAISNWFMFDSTRDAGSTGGNTLWANYSNAEDNGGSPLYPIEYTDTGFVIQNGSDPNLSGGTYIYMAFKDTREYAYWLDDSGNNNDWQPNGGITTNSTVTDTPTPYLGGGNYAVLNPLDAQGTATLSNANLTIASSTTAHKNRKATFVLPNSGKWYWEVTTGSTCGASAILAWGVQTTSAASDSQAGNANTWMAQNDANQDIWNQTTNILSTGSAVAGGSIRQVAYDSDSGKLWFGVNNSWYSSTDLTSGNPSAGTNQCMTLSAGDYFPTVTCYNLTAQVNFGQRPFAYTPPTGFKALHTGNLPDSAIVDGSEYFNTVTYTGDGTSSRAITGVGLQPDFVWIKSRSNPNPHDLIDSVRGPNKFLRSNATDAEGTFSFLTSFDSDGFTLGTNDNDVNGNGYTYVAWNWKANGAGVSNTDGSIASTVSANPTAGFSVVTFTNPSSGSGSIGHGLGVKPSIVIVKARSNTSNWTCMHKSLGTNMADKWINLESTAAVQTSSNIWGGEPTSSVFYCGTGIQIASATMLAYCFADVEGYSKFGSYTGNGSADGPFVYTGFRPAFIMWKRTDSSTGGEWVIQDTTRREFNPVDVSLYPNLSNAEATGETFRVQDTLSNGFKIRASAAQCNASGGTYIYAAFAENPFKNSLAR